MKTALTLLLTIVSIASATPIGYTNNWTAQADIWAIDNQNHTTHYSSTAANQKTTLYNSTGSVGLQAAYYKDLNITALYPDAVSLQILKRNIINQPAFNIYTSLSFAGSLSITANFGSQTALNVWLYSETFTHLPPVRDCGFALYDDSSNELLYTTDIAAPANEGKQTPLSIQVQPGKVYTYYLWQSFGSAASPIANTTSFFNGIMADFTIIPEPASILLFSFGLFYIKRKSV